MPAMNTTAATMAVLEQHERYALGDGFHPGDPAPEQRAVLRRTLRATVRQNPARRRRGAKRLCRQLLGDVGVTLSLCTWFATGGTGIRAAEVIELADGHYLTARRLLRMAVWLDRRYAWADLPRGPGQPRLPVSGTGRPTSPSRQSPGRAGTTRAAGCRGCSCRRRG